MGDNVYFNEDTSENFYAGGDPVSPFYAGISGSLAGKATFPEARTEGAGEVFHSGGSLRGYTLLSAGKCRADVYTGVKRGGCDFSGAFFYRYFQPVISPWWAAVPKILFWICPSDLRALHLNPLGDVLALLAAVVWAVYAVITRKISEFGYHTVQTTRRTFFYGLIFMIPAVVLMDFRVTPDQLLDGSNLGNILFLGLGASAVCFVTWNLAVRKLGYVRTSVYIYLVPVITTVTSVIVLHEKITAAAAGGIGLTLAGLFLSESGHRVKKQI